MLIFTRKKNEGLVIGDDVRIHVLDATTEWVKIGIEAPRRIPVHRMEVYKKIQDANLAAATSPLPESSAALLAASMGAAAGPEEEKK